MAVIDTTPEIYETLLFELKPEYKEIDQTAFNILSFHKEEINSWYMNQSSDEWLVPSVKRITTSLLQLNHVKNFPTTVNVLNKYLSAIGKDDLQLPLY